MFVNQMLFLTWSRRFLIYEKLEQLELESGFTLEMRFNFLGRMWKKSGLVLKFLSFLFVTDISNFRHQQRQHRVPERIKPSGQRLISLVYKKRQSRS